MRVPVLHKLNGTPSIGVEPKQRKIGWGGGISVIIELGWPAAFAKLDKVPGRASDSPSRSHYCGPAARPRRPRARQSSVTGTGIRGLGVNTAKYQCMN